MTDLEAGRERSQEADERVDWCDLVLVRERGSFKFLRADLVWLLAIGT